ncbi:MAG: hypothetical protein Ct9H300mP12_01950 [Acidimicrobiales bacterium]|nr:MAG: hypothetical protein Ct9H300mP12_01950 [Acidimicrobiales bacterium]
MPPFIRVPADAPLRLLTVHAHPDDEASKGASTVAQLHSEGVHCVLVCCTGGEAGDVLNPAMDSRSPRRLPGVREAELRAQRRSSATTRCYVGLPDSGMKDSEHNARADALPIPTKTRPWVDWWRSSGGSGLRWW